uniref:CMP/dCMP-type deaminase domain-containing protein n=1 Tax=Odontella aurita TaxID=265563 RepID=A0A7S4M9J3_9STRA|mmetsp:Transcript_14810/g.43225  ORF Transcript_14810/g.43225 Transcript_14810/m.43225 type:complete len:126 (+) Transcript_14810:300-677(+)
MFCGLVVGNSVVNVGTSSPSPGARLHGGSSNPSGAQSTNRHAEMDALRYLRTHEVRKARLVVVRFTIAEDEDPRQEGRGRFFGDSRPCVHCVRRIRRHHPNVSAVTFFEKGEWITESPEACSPTR